MLCMIDPRVFPRKKGYHMIYVCEASTKRDFDLYLTIIEFVEISGCRNYDTIRYFDR